MILTGVTGSRSMREETNVSNSSVRRYFLSYSIKPILGIYETITSWLSFVIVTDRSVGPAERTSKPVLRSWAGVRDSRKEVKILSRAADHHSRFGREPREQFLPFPFFSPPLRPSLGVDRLSREKHRGFACDQLPIKPDRIGCYFAPNRWPLVASAERPMRQQERQDASFLKL